MRIGAAAFALILLAPAAAQAGPDTQRFTLPLDQMYVGQQYHGGRYTQAKWSPWRSNHPLPWTYPSTYPWTNPVVYNAGPGNMHPAHGERMRQVRSGHRWTGHPPRHLFVVDYNGYAPPYYFLPHE